MRAMLTLLWSIELRLSGAQGAHPMAAARRLREMADSIERLPGNLIVGMGDLPMGRALGAGVAPGAGWRGTWSVREDRDELAGRGAEQAVERAAGP